MYSKKENNFFSASQHPLSVKGLRYEIIGPGYEISESKRLEDNTDYGRGTSITEIFIPSYQLIVNSEHYFFKSQAPRNTSYDIHQNLVIGPATEIFISNVLVAQLTRVVDLQLLIDDQRAYLEEVQMHKDKNVFRSINKILKLQREREDCIDNLKNNNELAHLLENNSIKADQQHEISSIGEASSEDELSDNSYPSCCIF